MKLGRLADEQKQAALTPKDNPPDAKPAVKKALGLDLAGLTDDLRKKHKIDEKVKGVVITAVDPTSSAAEKRLTPGMVIAEVEQQPVNTPAEFQSRHRVAEEGRQEVGDADGALAERRSRIVVLGLK